MKYNELKIGERIRTIREKENITQETLAEKFHISRNTLSKIENGVEKDGHPLVTFKFLLEFGECFNCDIGYLLGEHEEKTRVNADICKETGLSEKAINVLKRFRNEEQVITLWDYVISERHIFTELALWFDRYIKSRQYCKALEIKYSGYDLKTDGVINIYDFEKSEKENEMLSKPRNIYKIEKENEQPICLYKLQKQFIEFIEQIGNEKETEITSVKQYNEDVRGVNNGEHTGKTE